jgi:hypothetical protein
MSEESPEQQSATAMKLATAKQKKDTADQAFKQGDVTAGKYPSSPLPVKKYDLTYSSPYVLSPGKVVKWPLSKCGVLILTPRLLCTSLDWTSKLAIVPGAFWSAEFVVSREETRCKASGLHQPQFLAVRRTGRTRKRKLR